MLDLRWLGFVGLIGRMRQVALSAHRGNPNEVRRNGVRLALLADELLCNMTGLPMNHRAEPLVAPPADPQNRSAGVSNRREGLDS